MAGVTNRGKYLILRWAFQGLDYPTNIKVALCTSASTPDADTNTLSDLTEIAAGTGYTAGGYDLTRNGTDFDVITEGDSADNCIIQVKDVVWTASAGSIPNSGDGARWAVLTNDDSDADVIAYFDLTSDRSVSDGQSITLQNLQINATET